MTAPIRRALLVVTRVARVPGTERTTGASASELAAAWEVFTDAGFDVDLCTPDGGPVPLDGLDTAQPAQHALVADQHMGVLLHDAPGAAEIRDGGHDVAFLVGGHGAVWDLATPALARLLSDLVARGGVLAAVCHGPAGLLGVTDADGAPVVRGRRVAAFTDAEEHAVGMASVLPWSLSASLEERGAVHDAAPSFLPHVVVDGRLVTGQNPASARATAEAAVACLDAGPGSTGPGSSGAGSSGAGSTGPPVGAGTRVEAGAR